MNTEQLIEFAGNHPIYIAAGIAIIALLIGTEVARHFRGFKEIPPAEVIKLMNHSDALVLDVREKSDYRAGHVVGATNAPISQLESKMKTLASEYDKPIVTCCSNGALSAQAAKKLKEAGYSNVHALKGGLTAWRAENLPVSLKKS